MIKRHIFISAVILAFLFTAKSAAPEPWTVIDAVRGALSNHPQSLLAESLVEEARGEGRSALSLEPPNLTLRWDDIPANSRIDRHQERRIGVSQDFEFPLRYIWLKKAAGHSVDQARNERSAVLLDLESEILEEYRDSIKVYCSYIQDIYEGGGVSRFDARKSRIMAMEADNALRASQRAMSSAFTLLASMTNCDITNIELVSPLKVDPVDTTGTAAENLISSNPEFLAAQSEVSISGCERTLESTAWLPEMELTYFVRQEMLPDDEDQWALQLQLAIPIWFWWGGYGEIQASRARFKRARAELASYQMVLSSESERLIQEIRTYYEQYDLYRSEMLPLVEDEYQMVHLNFPLGTGTYMDLIEVQEELKDVREEYVEIIFDLYEKKIELDRLCGKSIVDRVEK